MSAFDDITAWFQKKNQPPPSQRPDFSEDEDPSDHLSQQTRSEDSGRDADAQLRDMADAQQSAHSAQPVTTGRDVATTQSLSDAARTFSGHQQDDLAAAKGAAQQAGVPGAQNATSAADLQQARTASTVRRPQNIASSSPAPFQQLATYAPGDDASQDRAPSDAGGPMGAIAKLAMGAGLNPEVAQFVSQRQRPQPVGFDIQAAMQDAAKQRGLAKLGNAGEMLAATLAHHAPNEQLLAQNLADADKPTATALAMQKANMEGSKAGLEGEKLRREMAADDPGSPETASERTAFKAALPKLAEKLPLDTMTATQIRGLYKNGLSGRKLADTEGNAETRNDLLRRAQELRKSGQTLQAQKLEQAAEALGLRREQFGKKVAENQVAGVDYANPYGAPTAKEAAGTRQYKESMSNFDRVVGEMQGILRQHGGQLGPTDARLLYDQLRNRAVPLISQMEQTGNLSRGHQHLIEAQLGGGLDSFTAWVNGGGMSKVLSSMQNEAHAGLKSKLEAQGGKAKAPARFRVSNGKETLEIDAGDEAEAARDGFKRVN